MGDRRSLAFILIFFGCAASARAQNPPAWEVFGGFSEQYAQMRQYFRQTPTIYNFRTRDTLMPGFEVSVTENKSRRFGGTFDIGVHFKSPDVGGVKNRQNLYTVMYGPRLSSRFGFAHFLLGAAYEKVAVTPVGPRASDLSFAFAVGGGYDLRVGKRTAIRVLQVDYFRSNNELTSHPHGIRAAAGLVWTLGERK
jgi:hypothetical protein